MGNAIQLSTLDRVLPATNIGEFNFQNYYQAKQIYQKLKYSSCQIKLLPITDFGDQLHQLRFELQNYLPRCHSC